MKNKKAKKMLIDTLDGDWIHVVFRNKKGKPSGVCMEAPVSLGMHLWCPNIEGIISVKADDL